MNVFRDELQAWPLVEEVAVGDLEDYSLYRKLIDEDPLPYSDSLHADFLGAFDRDDLREVLLRCEIYRAPLVLRYMDGFLDEGDRPAPRRSIRDDPARLHRGRNLFERTMWAYAEENKLIGDGDGDGWDDGRDPCSEAVRQLWNYLDHAIAPADRGGRAPPRSVVGAAVSSSSRRRSGRFLASGSSDEVPPT